MRPMWEEIEADLPELQTEYYDADENPELMEKYKIETLPTFIFLDKDDAEIERLVGAQNKEDLMKLVKENMVK